MKTNNSSMKSSSRSNLSPAAQLIKDRMEDICSAVERPFVPPRILIEPVNFCEYQCEATREIRDNCEWRERGECNMAADALAGTSIELNEVFRAFLDKTGKKLRVYTSDASGGWLFGITIDADFEKTGRFVRVEHVMQDVEGVLSVSDIAYDARNGNPAIITDVMSELKMDLDEEMSLDFDDVQETHCNCSACLREC
jgi:hypothetical protein